MYQHTTHPEREREREYCRCAKLAQRQAGERRCEGMGEDSKIGSSYRQFIYLVELLPFLNAVVYYEVILFSKTNLPNHLIFYFNCVAGLTMIYTVPSILMLCFVFFQKFWLSIRLHCSCSISPTAGGTFWKYFTKHHDWGDKTLCILQTVKRVGQTTWY